MGKPIDLVQGTLDFLILKAIELEPKHGWGIAKRIQQVSGDVLKVPQGSLYPALYRLERQGWITAQVGTDRLRTAGEVLHPHAFRPRTSQKGTRNVGSTVRSDQSGDSGDVGTLGWGANDAVVLRRAEWASDRCLHDGCSISSSMPISVSSRAGDGGVHPRRAVPDNARRAALKASEIRRTSWRTCGRLPCGSGGNVWLRTFGTASGGFGGRRRSPPRRCCPWRSESARPPLSSAFSIRWCWSRYPFVIRRTLFQVVHRGDGGASESPTYAFYEHLKGQSKTIAGVFLVDPSSTMRVLVDGQADAVVGQQVTGDYFNVLGIRPVIGSVIEPRDERGSPPNRVVVLGHAYWTRRFGRDPGVLGRTMTIDGVPHTIIGVTPPEFFGLQVGRRVDVTVPIDGSEEPHFWKSRALVVRARAGRIARGSRRRPECGLSAVPRRRQDPLGPGSRAERSNRWSWPRLSSGLPEFRDRYGKPVQAMLAIVGVLLLLGCANLASLFLARAATRQRDLSVCLAFGASRTRLARQAPLGNALHLNGRRSARRARRFWAVDVLVGFLPDVRCADGLADPS